MTDTCPASDRKSIRLGEAQDPPVDAVDGVWRVRSLATARALLREPHATVQAGFNAEDVRRAPTRPPLLFADRDAHRRQRRQVARFLTPKAVSENYRELMERRARELVDEMAAADEVDLADVSLRFSVDIAAEVIGLTASDRDAMTARLERFFSIGHVAPDAVRSRLARVGQLATAQRHLWWFHLKDVRPAARSRRREPHDDIISHLVAEGCSDIDVLIEVLTVAAAGMVTTREFISMAAWHLLERPALRAEFTSADAERRAAILAEVLRLEPVVGHLHRRATRDIRLDGAEGAFTVPEGALIDLFVRPANADVGDDGLRLCPGRPTPQGVGAEALSFGDGAHKCPGNALALQEADVLLRTLLAHDVTLTAPPRLGWNDVIAGYELRGMMLRVGQPKSATASS
ncbi:cytochrome P450 [Microbacterium sp.]|uniref:cytochrome P450 n=1 Tax=Microbacterium sp. TaxID=51671 RepID=UPI003A891677